MAVRCLPNDAPLALRGPLPWRPIKEEEGGPALARLWAHLVFYSSRKDYSVMKITSLVPALALPITQDLLG